MYPKVYILLSIKYILLANKVAFLYSFGNKQHNQYYPAIKTDNYHSHTLKAITDNCDFTKLS